MIYTSEETLKKILSFSQSDYTAISYEAITIGSSVSVLTIPDGARYAKMILESNATGNAIRWLETNQTTVTASVGMPLDAGGSLDVAGYANLAGFQVIKDQAGTTVLHVAYFK